MKKSVFANDYKHYLNHNKRNMNTCKALVQCTSIRLRRQNPSLCILFPRSRCAHMSVLESAEQTG